MFCRALDQPHIPGPHVDGAGRHGSKVSALEPTLAKRTLETSTLYFCSKVTVEGFEEFLLARELGHGQVQATRRIADGDARGSCCAGAAYTRMHAKCCRSGEPETLSTRGLLRHEGPPGDGTREAARKSPGPSPQPSLPRPGRRATPDSLFLGIDE